MKYIVLVLLFMPIHTLACNDERLHKKLMQREMFEAYLALGAASVELSFSNQRQVSVTISTPKPLHHVDIELESSHNIQLGEKKFIGIDNLDKLPNVEFDVNGKGFSFIKAHVTAYFSDGTIRKSKETIYLREWKA